MEVSFIVPGNPVPKGRPRFGGGNVYTHEDTRDYEEWVQWHARVAMKGRERLRGPLSLQFNAVYGVPASWGKARTEACLVTPEWKSTRPDIDNIEKALTDACNGVVYADDGQIVLLHNCMKVWGANPRVEITLKELS